MAVLTLHCAAFIDIRNVCCWISAYFAGECGMKTETMRISLINERNRRMMGIICLYTFVHESIVCANNVAGCYENQIASHAQIFVLTKLTAMEEITCCSK